VNALELIIADKKISLARQKQLVPVGSLEGSPMFSRKTSSLREQLSGNQSSGIIAEFKRRSPSAGMINENADPVKVCKGYMQAGAAGLSVLTEENNFAGSTDDLVGVRKANSGPILRKDFIIDEYQVLEAKAIGADVILLIAAVLNKSRVRDLSVLAHSLGLEVLLEIHEESDLRVLNENIDIVGVNNRDLKKMITDVKTSLDMAEIIPVEFLKISESGISDPQTIGKHRETESVWIRRFSDRGVFHETSGSCRSMPGLYPGFEYMIWNKNGSED
jgi:indole-3-glycerol phosphate synthase